MTKKKKKLTQKQIEDKIKTRRLGKILDKMRSQKMYVQPGHHRIIYEFSPDETGIEVPAGKKKKDYFVKKSLVVKYFEENPELPFKENRKRKDEYYNKIRKNLLEEIRESVQMPIILPDQHDPEAGTTIDLEKLTSAGVSNVDEGTDPSP